MKRLLVAIIFGAALMSSFVVPFKILIMAAIFGALTGIINGLTYEKIDGKETTKSSAFGFVGALVITASSCIMTPAGLSLGHWMLFSFCVVAMALVASIPVTAVVIALTNLNQKNAP